MRGFFLVVFLCMFMSLHATNYYFSTTTGDDSRSAVQAQNASTPWRTLNKLNTIYAGLLPGDSVLFKRGDVFDGTISVGKSGSSSRPIVFSAYGAGNRPVINGFVTLSSWNAVGNGVWECTSSLLNVKTNMVTVNNVEYAMGRYPNKDAQNGGYLTYESHVGNTQITDNQLTGAINWTGAEVVIRKVRGVIDRNPVLSHSGTVINYASGGSIYSGSDNFGYFFQNDVRTLDQVGEWFYNSGQKKLSMYFGSNSPSSYTVKASTADFVVNVNSQSNIVFRDLAIQGANLYNFRINGAQNVSVINCDVLFSGETAVKASYTSYLRVEGCTIQNSNDNGVDMAYNNDHASIKNNKIENTSLLEGMGTSGDSNGTGINARGRGTVVEGNQVLNTGYNGIAFTDDSVVVKNNFINNFAVTKDDAGGIYTYIGAINVVYYGRKVTGNIILNGLGAGAGTDNPAYLPVHGIFLDDNASGVDMRDNTIAHCGQYGIFFHNAHDNVFKNNTLFNNLIQVYLRNYDTNYGDVINNDISGNILYSKYASQMATALVSTRTNVGSFGRFDSNYYCRPLNDQLMIRNDYIFNYGNSTKSDAYDLQSWKARSAQDAASQTSPAQIPWYTVDNVAGANKIANGTFNTGINYLSCWTPVGSCNTSWSSGSKMDGGSLQVAFSSPSGSGFSGLTAVPVGSVVSGKTYRIKFSLAGSIDNRSLSVYLRSNNTYSKITPMQYVKLGTARTENELLFSVPGNDEASFVMELNDQFSTYWIDNLEMYEVNVSYTNPDNFIRFEYNPSYSPQTITLNDTYLDAKRNTYSGSVTLQPFGSIVLVKSTKSNQTINFPGLGSKTYGDAPFTLNASASSGLPVSYRVVSGPATLSGNVVTLTGAGTVVIEASQAGNSSYNPASAVTQSFVVSSASSGCSAAGYIMHERWNNLPGWSISTIPLQNAPDVAKQLYSLESLDAGQLYGARIRGYICPPQNGNYTFYLAGDDVLELWLSTDDNPVNKRKISSSNYTMFREYYKYPSQTSSLINLVANKRYYVEVLYKEGGGGGHVSVQWQLPSGVLESPIPGSRLSPYTANAFSNAVAAPQSQSQSAARDQADSREVFTTYPNPVINSGVIAIIPSESGQATIDICDVQGRLVKNLFRGNLVSGERKTLSFRPEGLSAGVYYIRLVSKTKISSKKIILMIPAGKIE